MLNISKISPYSFRLFKRGGSVEEDRNDRGFESDFGTGLG